MLNFLRQNYGRTLWIVRIALGFSILLDQLFGINTTFGLLALMGMSVPKMWYFYLFYGVITLVVCELIIRLLVKFAMTSLKVFVIPFNEFVVLFMGAMTVSNVISGLIKLVYFITPAAAVFGEVLINFVVSAFVYFGLFLLVKKLYLNDKNAPFVFKSFAIIFFCATVITTFIF